MRYMLRIHVCMMEIPEPDFPPDDTPPKDATEAVEGAVHAMAKTAQRLFSAPGMMMPAMEPGGLDFRKTVAITAPSFTSAAQILGQFDALTASIQLERV